MNIAIIHDWLTGFAGAEKVLLELIKIYPEADIYTSVFNDQKIKQIPRDRVKVSYLQKIPGSNRGRRFLIPLMPQAFENFNLSKYDLVISNTSSVGKGVITRPETPHICYCHTPTRYLWESNLDPRASGNFLKDRISHRLRIWDRLAAMRPDYFIANSKNIQQKIKKYYRRESEVVYPPVEVGRFKVTDKKEIKDYYLCSGRLVGYKRVDLAIAAFNDLKKPLFIIGSGPEEKRLRAIAGENIKFLGRVSDQEQAKYYREARAFIFPADEDFGIVPLEALASGRPVIAFNAGGARETITEGISGTFFSEQTPQCLIDAVRNFNPDHYRPESLRQRAMDFDQTIFRKNFKDTVDRLVVDFQKNGPPIK